MVGFIKGFFGSKPKPQDDAVQSQTDGAPESSNGAFFLEPDDAKTFGNIEYMRTPKTIRRTFPKTSGNGGEFDRVQQVSAMKMMPTTEQGTSMSVSPAPTPAPPSPPQPTNLEAEERRRTDSGMDMFRRMARDMKKS